MGVVAQNQDAVFGKITCREPVVVDSSGELRCSINNYFKHGGNVRVFGKGEGEAVMGINQYGNGAFTSYHKNGYRQ